MQLADRTLPTPHPAKTVSTPRSLSAVNQGVFQQLKLVLSLNLRRQIFLAVCDDLDLRNQLAAQLYAELAYPAQPSSGNGGAVPERSSSPSVVSAGIQMDALAVAPPLPVSYPRLVSLNLNLADPNPMAQIAQWLAQYPPPQNIYPKSQPPGFQILGAERLMRQSAAVQRHFLDSLQNIEAHLGHLESALLLWLPRPWLHAIQQSAPNFWQWHTALFEFEGDPTPVPMVRVVSSPVVAEAADATPSPRTG